MMQTLSEKSMWVLHYKILETESSKIQKNKIKNKSRSAENMNIDKNIKSEKKSPICFIERCKDKSLHHKLADWKNWNAEEKKAGFAHCYKKRAYDDPENSTRSK